MQAEATRERFNVAQDVPQPARFPVICRSEALCGLPAASTLASKA